MKKIITTLLIVLASFCYGAKYKGEDIDGSRYECVAYNSSTHKKYNAKVEFYDNEAIIIIGSEYIVVTLTDSNIKNIKHIRAYDCKECINWRIKVK